MATDSLGYPAACAFGHASTPHLQSATGSCTDSRLDTSAALPVEIVPISRLFCSPTASAAVASLAGTQHEAELQQLGQPHAQRQEDR